MSHAACITELLSWWAVFQKTKQCEGSSSAVQAAFSLDRCSFVHVASSGYWDCSLACAKTQTVLGNCFIHSWNVFSTIWLFPLHCRSTHWLKLSITQIVQHESPADTQFSAVPVPSNCHESYKSQESSWILSFYLSRKMSSSILCTKLNHWVDNEVPPIESLTLFLQDLFLSRMHWPGSVSALKVTWTCA